MLTELSKHPSNIARSAVEYLGTIELSEKSKRMYEEVLYFFVESLLSDPSAVAETDNEQSVLHEDWDAYYGGAISGFIDWWIPRKVMDDTLQARAPGVLRKWIKWCYEHNYFDEDHYKDYLEALPRNKSREVKRLQEAGDLLYLIHSPEPGEWMEDNHEKVVSISHKREPEDMDEGYMQIIKLTKDSAYLENEEGETRGPVMLGRKLVQVLKVGDVINVVIGRSGKRWWVLESGNVYAEDTIF
ncbi:MAG: hypothetical protein ACOC6B_00135 [Thermodesulfobacteriota bacterium]